MKIRTHEKTVVVMGEEPSPKLSSKEALELYLAAEDEQGLADIYAAAENKAWWFAHDIDDYEEGTQEYKEQCKLVDDWFSLVKKIEADIFKILRDEGVKNPKTGVRYVLQPFMARNGYFDGAGWWIKNSEEILEKMSDSEGKHISLTFSNGNILDGYVDVFSTRYDNDGEASICFAGENGEMLVVEESDIEDIVIK